MNPLFYSDRAKSFFSKEQKLKRQLGWFSVFRLLAFLVFIFCIYWCTQNSTSLPIVMALLAFVGFLFLIRYYTKLQNQKIFYGALKKINEQEEAFLKTNKPNYDCGKKYEDPQHSFSYDLDFFAEGGLFSYLNRCSTDNGKAALAQNLLHPNTNEIQARQQAVKELSEKLDLRQQLQAHGSLFNSKKKDLSRLNEWLNSKEKPISYPLYYTLLLFPLFTIGALLYYLFTENEIAFSIFSKLFVVNFIIVFGFAKKLKAQLSISSSVNKILLNYNNQLKLLEKETFTAPFLKSYQSQFKNGNKNASELISQLANLFNYLDTVVNLIVSILLNGLFIFHVHVLYRLELWKKHHAHQVSAWINIVGQMEALSSFANLSYNNPNFCFPAVCTNPNLEAFNLGHFLVNPKHRVYNNISFSQEKFVILTGSNMSGKSTFLRTLGINLALAKAGSVVCAKQFSFFPFEIFVSMRITDSLQDSESLFYAELKRLQSIITNLKNGNESFVILDEILRGTNSNDKRNGTIGLIRKMAGFDTFGIIATHDLAVAELIKEYPKFISNMAFESAIINGELIFDYKLKNGVCNSLSASYLMKKMDII